MIIITGASKSIGRYLFERFRDLREEVIGTYNSTTLGFQQDINKYYKVDISDYSSVCRFIEQIEPNLKNIVLLNCAGITYNSFAHKANVELWSQVIDVNLKGSFYMINKLLPYMREQGYGRIINFSSVLAILPTLGVSAYSASKAGLVGMTKSIAIENGSKGITANAINLGYVNVGMGINDVPMEMQEALKAKIPSGRFCNPEEIFSTVKYLIETEYVNGSSLDINGGLI